MTVKGFLAGFGVAVFMLAATLIYRSYYVYCPCGFKYDAFSGGCVVDLNPPPCTDQGGGNSPGGKSGASGSGTYAAPPPYSSSCELKVANCGIRPDFRMVEFTLVSSSGTVPIGAPPQLPVSLNIAQQNKTNVGCAHIAGTIDVPVNVPTMIPIDPAALSGLFPLTSSTAPGPPTGLTVSINEPCPAAQTQMLVIPTQKPECGCKVAFKRDTFP